jgi:hypothetical protein
MFQSPPHPSRVIMQVFPFRRSPGW